MFYLLWLIAQAWKNLEFLSPSFSHKTLPSYFHISSSLSNHLWTSCFALLKVSMLIPTRSLLWTRFKWAFALFNLFCTLPKQFLFHWFKWELQSPNQTHNIFHFTNPTPLIPHLVNDLIKPLLSYPHGFKAEWFGTPLPWRDSVSINLKWVTVKIGTQAVYHTHIWKNTSPKRVCHRTIIPL